MSPRNLIFAIILGSALAAGIFAAIKSGPKSSSPATPEFAFMLPSPGALPAFSLRDQTGAAVDADTFRGQWDLVFFGFSNCPDICPTTLQVLTSARRKLIRSGSKPVPRIVFVSVDPERDTPDRLGQYVDHFGDGILAVSGDIEEIRKLTTALGMFFQKVDRPKPAITVSTTLPRFLCSTRTGNLRRCSVPRRSLTIICTTCRSS